MVAAAAAGAEAVMRIDADDARAAGVLGEIITQPSSSR